MNYFRLDITNPAVPVTGIASSITNEQRMNESWVCRCDFETLAEATAVAQAASVFSGETYIATDTPNQYPRFDAVRVPHVGDEVSYSFNGDTYPDGVIVKVSPSMIVTTDTGSKYRRVGQTGGWRKDGMWWLVRGHHNERNECF